jgi:inhibitor of KinA sporulation pathway (predicted exonuclease)
VIFEPELLLVVDLEATCWLGHPPEGQLSEIIEIGISAVDLFTAEIISTHTALVIPTHSEISAFCTELTHITPELIAEQGMSFEDACEWLIEDYHSDRRLWGSWGAWDMKTFKAQCEARGVPYPFSAHHVNLRSAFTKQSKRHPGGGLIKVLEGVELGFEGTPHRGIDDAYNTARLMRWLLIEHGTQYFKKKLPPAPPPPTPTV